MTLSLCSTEQQGQRNHLNFWLSEFWRSPLNTMPSFSFKKRMWGVGVLCAAPGGRRTEVKRAWCFVSRLVIFFSGYNILQGSTNFFQRTGGPLWKSWVVYSTFWNTIYVYVLRLLGRYTSMFLLPSKKYKNPNTFVSLYSYIPSTK